MAKQCLANPREFGHHEASLIEKGIDAVDEIQMLWVSMRNSTKVDWLTCPYCNGTVVDWEEAKCIH